MTIRLGIVAFDLDLPFAAGGMDASGFTVPAGTAQGGCARPAAGLLPANEATSLCAVVASCLTTALWLGGALLR
jgi:hypothetical protein